MENTNPARIYDEVFVPGLMLPCARRLLEAARPCVGERVLDIGTGTGLLARLAAPMVGENGMVVGLDASEVMLEVAREAAEREGLSIEWTVSSAEALPFLDDSVDLVLCQAAMMFFSDRSAATKEMRRVLSPGGRAAVAVFQSLNQHPFYQALDAMLQHRFGISGVSDIFAFGDRDALRELLLDAGFTDVEVSSFTVTSGYPDPDAFLDMEIAIDTAVVPSLQQMGADERRRVTSAIRADIEPVFRRYVEGGLVAIPMHLNLALAS